MAVLQWTCFFSLLVSTTQLHVQPPVEAADPEAPEGPGTGMMGFGGMFEAVDAMKEQMRLADQAGQPLEQNEEESNLIGQGRKSGESLSWPNGSWKALMSKDDKYAPKADGPKYPMSDSKQCSDKDMKEIHYWALKQAKSRLPAEGRNASGPSWKEGTCYRNNKNKYIGLHVPSWAKCYQKFYNVSTPCARCIGSVYQMATLNVSEPCYNFCKGRPSRKDGAHWCWEDCQSCMWYVGHRLSICYGEPYDMVCRYAKELGKEHWYERNGIDSKDR